MPTQKPAEIFLTLHGVPSHDRPATGEHAYFRDPQGAWRPIHGDHLDDISSIRLTREAMSVSH